jgi:hypothetical protein
MDKLLIRITQYLIGILHRKGYNIGKLKPIEEHDLHKSKLINDLYETQKNLSLLRAEIIQKQVYLLKSMKEPMTMLLKNMEDTEDRTQLMNSISKQYKSINLKIDDHQIKLKEYENSFNNLEEFNKKKQIV